MADRPTAKEVSIDLAGFKSSVDVQFAGVDKQISLLVKMVVGVYVLLGAIVGGGFLLRSDLGDIKAKVAEEGAEITGLRRDVTALQSRISALDKNTSDLAAAQSQMLAIQGQINNSLIQINSKLPPVPATQLLALGPDEEQIIRDFFGMAKGPASEPPKYRIGDSITGTTTMPDSLVLKLPKLKGFTYAKDPSNGSVLIADNGRVVAIIARA